MVDELRLGLVLVRGRLALACLVKLSITTLPAAPVRNCRKARRIALLIAKTLFLT
jgi:hypothetical protein